MVEETEKTETQETQQDEKEKPLDRLTAPELREIAKDIPGVEGVHAMKKEQLLAIIKEARGIKDDTPAQRKKKAAKVTMSVSELKQKVVRLKEEKKTARTSKGKKEVDVLRRRMNRLKKKTRKTAQA